MNAQYRIVTNTVVLYVKMLLSVFITFYSTRIVLKALGVNDFGIYNLVAGAISLLGFVNGSMSNTVQRFFAFELGVGSLDRLRRTFSTSVSIHLIVGIGLVLVLEFFGILAFDYLFLIDKDSIFNAKIAYQIMICITFIITISSPLTACIYAHEDIALFAIVELFVSILKLFSAFLLLDFSNYRLEMYCVFLLIIQLLYFAFEIIYCRIKYKECRYGNLLHIDKGLAREIFPFLGWNMLESFSWVIKNQGVSVLMNSFYGTVVNAAYGVGSQIQGQVMYFSTSLLNAIRPQIYKLGGSGEIGKMLSLSETASKLAFFVLLVLFSPLVFILDEILRIWLGVVPEYTERICIILLIISLINYMSIGINIAIQAYGNVKVYQIIASLIIIISIPISYFVYSLQDDVYLLLYIMVVIEIISVLSKYYVASHILKCFTSRFIKTIFLPCTIVFVISITFTYFLANIILLERKPMDYILFICADVLIVIIVIFLGGFTKFERNIIFKIIKSIKFKLFDKIVCHGKK